MMIAAFSVYSDSFLVGLSDLLLIRFKYVNLQVSQVLELDGLYFPLLSFIL